MASGIFVILLLALLLGGGLWIGLSLLMTGALTLSLYRDLPVIKLVAFEVWQSLNSQELAALILFILMGEILFNTRLSRNLFDGLSPWLARVPGGLLHTNILGCTLFAAVSGSSAATTATIGRMTLSELEARGYDRDLAIGSLFGAGTLGFLIPPSIILILYGVLAEVSILDLFMAGILPGLMLAGLYMGYIMLRAGPSMVSTDTSPAGLSEKLRGLIKLSPVILLILAIMSSMYFGIASPSEAAIIGVTGALIVAGFDGSLSRETLSRAFTGTVKTVSMIGLILMGALLLTRAMAFLGLPTAFAETLALFDLSPLGLMAVLFIFYIILGMVLDGLSIIIMTLPLTLPLVLAAGFSDIWFAIFLVIVVEMAQITPPVGFNLFVVQSLTGEPISRIAKASLPFFLIMAGFAALITIFPGLATWLPGVL